MTWPDFRAGDPARWIAVLPVAAVEQHGPHLPLGVDGHIAETYLAAVEKLLPETLPVTSCRCNGSANPMSIWTSRARSHSRRRPRCAPGPSWATACIVPACASWCW
jgi:hypothetical protein